MRMGKGKAASAFLLAVLGSFSAVAADEKKPSPGECVATNSLEAYLGRNPPKDVLALADGTRIKTAEEWTAKVRPAVLKFFDEGVYGMMPPKPAKIDFRLVEFGYSFDGAARRRQYVIHSEDANGTHEFTVLVYLPRELYAP